MDGAEELPLGFAPDTAKFVELPGTGELQQLVDGVNAEAVEHVQQAGAQTEQRDRGVECRCAESRIADGISRRLVFGMGGGGAINGLEDAIPRLEHLLRVVEALAIIAVQGGAEELGELIPQVRIADLDTQGDLLIGKARLAALPPRTHAGGNLVERHRHGVEFGAEVVALRLPVLEEGINVVRGSDPQLGGCRAREREIEKA